MSNKEERTIKVTSLSFIDISFNLCWHIAPKVCEVLRKRRVHPYNRPRVQLVLLPQFCVYSQNSGPEGDSGKKNSPAASLPECSYHRQCRHSERLKICVYWSRTGWSRALRGSVWVICLWHPPGWGKSSRAIRKFTAPLSAPAHPAFAVTASNTQVLN